MREIIFRAKRADNGEWIKGMLKVHLVDGDIKQKEREYFITVQWVDKIGKVYRYDHEVIPETVSQYTGLGDKNGKKIFEGDVDKEVGICMWVEQLGAYGFIPPEMVKESDVNLVNCTVYKKAYDMFEEYGVDGFLYNLPTVEYIEISGNIFDNLELLGGE